MSEILKSSSQISVGDIVTGIYGNWDAWYEIVSIERNERTIVVELLKYAPYSKESYPTTTTRTPLNRVLRCQYPNNVKFRVLKRGIKTDQLIAKIKYLDKKYDWKGKLCRS